MSKKKNVTVIIHTDRRFRFIDVVGSNPSLQKTMKTATAGLLPWFDSCLILLQNAWHELDCIHEMYLGFEAFEFVLQVMTV